MQKHNAYLQHSDTFPTIPSPSTRKTHKAQQPARNKEGELTSAESLRSLCTSSYDADKALASSFFSLLRSSISFSTSIPQKYSQWSKAFLSNLL